LAAQKTSADLNGLLFLLGMSNLSFVGENNWKIPTPQTTNYNALSHKKGRHIVAPNKYLIKSV